MEMWTVKSPEEKWVWCCYLRPAPEELSFDTHYAYNHVMDAMNKQQWYPHYCYYCSSCPLPNPDAWENHVLRHHPGKLANPGNAPLLTKILEIVEKRDRRDSCWSWKIQTITSNDRGKKIGKSEK